MEEILRFKNYPLRNEEYFNHKLEVLQAIEQSEIDSGPMEPVLTAFKKSVKDVDDALELIRKSLYTEQIEKADNARDIIISGFVDAVRSCTKHFDPKIREQAAELKLITDHFKGINQQSVISQTASTINMLQELRAKANILDALGFTAWVNQIEAENNNVSALTMNRFEESASKPSQRMKEVRPECEKQLERLYKAIETFAVITPSSAYNRCISLINSINKKYMDIIALRKGIAK